VSGEIFAKVGSGRAGVDTAGIPQVGRTKAQPDGVNAVYAGRPEKIYYPASCPARVECILNEIFAQM
jgi:hypothetical protein